MVNEIARFFVFFLASGAMLCTIGFLTRWCSDRAAVLDGADTLFETGLIIGMISGVGMGCLVIIQLFIEGSAPVSPCS